MAGLTGVKAALAMLEEKASQSFKRKEKRQSVGVGGRKVLDCVRRINAAVAAEERTKNDETTRPSTIKGKMGRVFFGSVDEDSEAQEEKDCGEPETNSEDNPPVPTNEQLSSPRVKRRCPSPVTLEIGDVTFDFEAAAILQEGKKEEEAASKKIRLDPVVKGADFLEEPQPMLTLKPNLAKEERDDDALKRKHEIIQERRNGLQKRNQAWNERVHKLKMERKEISVISAKKVKETPEIRRRRFRRFFPSSRTR